jgi:hypothetical protein
MVIVLGMEFWLLGPYSPEIWTICICCVINDRVITEGDTVCSNPEYIVATRTVSDTGSTCRNG